MYFLTCLNSEQLMQLVREHKLVLNNSNIFFQPNSKEVDSYLKTLAGDDGYVLGVSGVPLNESSAETFTGMIKNPTDMFLMEMDLDPNEMERFSFSGLDEVCQLVYYNMDSISIVNALTSSLLPREKKGPAVACIPNIDMKSKVRIASLDPDVELEIAVDNISVVKLHEKEGDNKQ